MTHVWSSSDDRLNDQAAFRVELLERHAVIVASGEIDLFTAPAFREAMQVATHVSDRVVVDLTEVTFIDSTGVGVLIRAPGSRSGTTHLVRPAGIVRKVLHVTQLDQLVTIVDTVEEALRDDTTVPESTS
jgi:anti-sigma B factor antagonist